MGALDTDSEEVVCCRWSAASGADVSCGCAVRHLMVDHHSLGGHVF